MIAVSSDIGSHHDRIDGVRRALNGALRGKAAAIEHVLAGVLAHGHLLLEDLPGLGKTTLAKALACAIGGAFARVQCTPDLLPDNITGFNVFNQKTREFDFVPGPVFADVLLADEINRTSPRTQSALLEAMAERQVTIDNVRHTLSPSFLVLATQNPVEHHGTYPLPEAQLDRFAMKLRLGHPSPEEAERMLASAIGAFESDRSPPAAVLPPGALTEMQRRVAAISVEPAIRAYLVRLGEVTRSHPDVRLGLSPRGLLIWQRVAQAWAFLRGREFVTPDDVQDVAGPVLEVRIGIEPETFPTFLQGFIESVPVPTSR
ncbi:MAG: MoxR family ATPase [Gemmataceae bacterium]